MASIGGMVEGEGDTRTQGAEIVWGRDWGSPGGWGCAPILPSHQVLQSDGEGPPPLSSRVGGGETHRKSSYHSNIEPFSRVEHENLQHVAGDVGIFQ